MQAVVRRYYRCRSEKVHTFHTPLVFLSRIRDLRIIRSGQTSACRYLRHRPIVLCAHIHISTFCCIMWSQSTNRRTSHSQHKHAKKRKPATEHMSINCRRPDYRRDSHRYYTYGQGSRLLLQSAIPVFCHINISAHTGSLVVLTRYPTGQHTTDTYGRTSTCYFCTSGGRTHLQYSLCSPTGDGHAKLTAVPIPILPPIFRTDQ